MSQPKPNALIRESSPYLLQHAHNPVDWNPWGEEALTKARRENKLLLVSIGYSSCHWCHVMEHESFEDPEVAELMNDRFVSIKVDREERPDIDHVFMTAVQMMNQQGGWPLNCIALPDGRPIWGTTYLPREQWISALRQVDAFHRENPGRTEEIAGELADGIRQNSLVTGLQEGSSATDLDMTELVETISPGFDRKEGGLKGAPKFPMPAALEFLLHYGEIRKDPGVSDFVRTTLIRMARGGIHDQAGGGFARYSVDAAWKVPHFEKMLYDNGQLLGLYSKGYQVFRDPEMREVVYGISRFLENEMLGPDGLYYSALDADSEGEEGKFYTWGKPELEPLLGEDYDLFAEYYNVNDRGLWENGRYILLRSSSPVDFARDRGMDPERFSQKVMQWNALVADAREKRVRPGTDDKCLASWNALALSGYASAYRAFGDSRFLEYAARTAGAVKKLMQDGEGTLHRNYKGGRRSIPGFLDDYALYIAGCLDLYEAGQEETWLELSREMTSRVLEKFRDPDDALFRYHESGREVLITHHHEIRDSVIPSSNAVMAFNLLRLGHLLARRDYLERAEQMAAQVEEWVRRYPLGFSGWARLYLMIQDPCYEIAVVGPDARAVSREIMAGYLPHAVVASTEGPGNLPLFRDRYQPGKTRIFVCRDQQCELPVEETDDAKKIYDYQ